MFCYPHCYPHKPSDVNGYYKTILDGKREISLGGLGNNGFYRTLKNLEMVEVAGFEPASEIWI